MTSRGKTVALIALLAIGFGATDAALVVTSHPARSEDSTSVDARLQRLEDREAIRELIVEYGHMVDTRNWPGFANLFAEDGEWVGGMGDAKGRATIQKMMEDTMGSGAPTLPGTANGPNLHIFTNEVIKVNGGTATGVTKWMFVVTDAQNHPKPFYLGHYDDKFVRVNGEWKFQRRAAYGDIPQAAPNMTAYEPAK
jgi:uncharacterized protein (TIGR02246 family)